MNELYHHGILGQRWGVRRYQNKDGTYTEAGKKRYGHNDRKKNDSVYKPTVYSKDNEGLFGNVAHKATKFVEKTTNSRPFVAKMATLSEKGHDYLYNKVSIYKKLSIHNSLLFAKATKNDPMKKLLQTPESKLSVADKEKIDDYVRYVALMTSSSRQ